MLNSLTDPNTHIDQLFKSASESENTKVSSHLKKSVFDKLDAAAIPPSTATTTGSIISSKIIIASSIILAIVAIAVWSTNTTDTVETTPQIKTDEQNTIKVIPQNIPNTTETKSSDTPIVKQHSTPTSIPPSPKTKVEEKSTTPKSEIISPVETDTAKVPIEKKTQPTEIIETTVVEKTDSVKVLPEEVTPKKSLMEKLKEKEFEDNLFKKDQ